MRRAFLLAVLVASCASMVPGQTPPPLEENLQLVAGGAPDIYSLSWFARTGRTYFVQFSEDLHDAWGYFPVIKTGADSYEVLGIFSSGPTLFFRLQYTDQTAANPESADFDGDGLSNVVEITAYDTNPLDADSDGDGSTDAEEVAAQTDPRTAGNAAGTWSTADIVGGALQEGAVFLIIDEEGNTHGVTKPAMLLKPTEL